MTSSIALWEAPETPASLPASAPPEVIAARAIQLTPRERKAIVEAFSSGGYEMASTFVWTRAMAALKKQLASLGTDFVGEMLGRPDITEDSPAESVLTDTDAVRLAADLGMIAPTEALRLRHALETVQHFASRETAVDSDEMTHEEAVSCLRACVQSVLSQERVEVALKFAEFRRELETRDFTSNDPKMQQLGASPYLFQRTTLNVLLALVKTSNAPVLEHALANINTVLPVVWPHLRKPEKYQTGETYTFVYTAGKATAASGLAHALLKVNGFDFVPETLRSETFIRAATAVIQAHEAANNFYNEAAPMKLLASLGTSVPIAAFPQCISATLCVWLGNRYGEAWSAQDSALALLRSITADRWDYYLNECLPGDRRILDKLWHPKPQARWMTLVNDFALHDRDIRDPRVRRLIDASRTAATLNNVALLANKLLEAYGAEV